VADYSNMTIEIIEEKQETKEYITLGDII